jgi:hypothetical protein
LYLRAFCSTCQRWAYLGEDEPLVCPACSVPLVAEAEAPVKVPDLGPPQAACTLYYRTTAANAARTLREGFRDHVDLYSQTRGRRGVLLTDRREEDAAAMGGLVTIEMDESIVAEYEWIEEGKPYRQFLVPAAVVNEHGKVMVAPP